MDSLHFMQFCLLLLTVASPCPNIAMPSANPAEETVVTVYQCKENICNLHNYEGCEKIGETQNKIFSNEIIHLVTSETHITMCFQKENTFPEGVYGIFWVKDFGVGDSCGTPHPTVDSLQNVTDTTIKFCCEAEINLSVPNRSLNCSWKMSGWKESKSIANLASGEPPDNSQFSISEKSSRIIITLLIILLVFCGAVVAVCCSRRNRNYPGRVHHFYFH